VERSCSKKTEPESDDRGLASGHGLAEDAADSTGTEAYDALKRKRDRAARQKAYYQGRMRALKGRGRVCARAAEPALETPDEAVFTTPTGDRQSVDQTRRVDRERDGIVKKGLHSTYDETVRYDLAVTVTKVNYRVETVTDPTTGRAVRASMEDVGPAGFQLTWRAIANVVKLVVGFAIPVNRLELIVGSPQFSSGKSCRVMKWAANLLLPVYLYLADALAEADVLAGDDSPTKVLEKQEPPLDDCAERIHDKIDKRLGWRHARADGKGDKKSLNVSLVMGKTVAADKRSTVCFFRTHLGNVGNLLERILESRRRRSGRLVFQGDLSAANLPSTATRLRVALEVAGCMAHARRPFWRYRDDDEDFCYYMLRGFLLLTELEQRIDEAGRTTANVLALRGKYGRWIWIALRNRCIGAMTGRSPTPASMPAVHGVLPTRWPPDSKLHEAAAYVVENFDELTLYLRDARLEATNNRRERALRAEKTMLVASKFRKTRDGRAVLDVLRTLNATCTSAGVELADYLRHVNAHRRELADHPDRHTPYAVALRRAATKA
jgi:hypothetical protein